MNLLVLALVVASVRLANRPHAAPALLGAAIALKLTPALLLIYWCVKGRFQYAVQVVLWAAVFMLAPWLVVQGGAPTIVGGSRWWRLLTHGLPDFGVLVERLILSDLR